MNKYENGIWKLLNIDELSRFESGINKGRIDNKKCVGMTLKYELKINGIIYEIKIVDYIEGYKENSKQTKPKFKVEYVYLEGTEYEEVIEEDIDCNHLINKAGIGGFIPSLNQWIKKEDYWIGIDTKGREFKFSSGNKDTEYNILHSTWSIENGGYITTNNLSYTKQSWKMHKAIYFNCNKEEADKNIHMCIDHINNNRADNRIENLRLVSKTENSKNLKTNNKYGLVGLYPNYKGYYSHFMFEGYKICTKTKHDLEEAKIDNLIAQKHLGYKHNEDQFWKIEHLSEERIKEVTDLLDNKIENNKNKIKKEKEYSYGYIEKDNLIGIKTFKKDGTENPICWVDRDFGKIEGDKFTVKGRVCNGGKGYFKINNNQLHVYIMVEDNSVHNYRNNNFHIDHINQKPNKNYRDNLEIVTVQSNMKNKESKGYTKYERKSGVKYMVYYGYNWEYFNLYIGGLKNPLFNAEEEAIAEVKSRRKIMDKYRFRIGWQGSVEANIEALDEVIDFAEEHKLDIDSAYIVWKGLDTEENIKNYLNSIDK